MWAPASAPNARPEPAFKLWLRHAKPTLGRVVIDAGAAAALRERGTSLLAVGVLSTEGGFQAGDAVEVVSGPGQTIVGKGISAMSSDEIAHRGRASNRTRCASACPMPPPR